VWARWTALDVLRDAVCFGYEPEGARMRVDGEDLPVDEAFRRMVAYDADVLFAVVCDTGAPDALREAALAILDRLEGFEVRLRAVLTPDTILARVRPVLPGVPARDEFATCRAQWLREHGPTSGPPP
jgi:hypothetical protein